MSLSMRLSSIANQGRGSFGVVAGLVVGCGITYFANRSFDRAKLDGINATPVVTKPSECSTPKTTVADPAGGLARNEIKPVVQRAALAEKETEPAEKETDLVRAVARGLSKSDVPNSARGSSEHPH